MLCFKRFLTAMYLTELVVFLLSFYHITSGFFQHDRGKYLNNLFKQITDPEIVAQLSDLSQIETKWMNQPLDHFDNSENRTWQMKYFQRLDMWKPNGPVYLFVNGELPAQEAFLQVGTVFDLASETNGAIFSPEHRYYGQSIPLNDLSTENLKYLSSRQALADNANLLKQIKSDPKFASSKVVVAGGSYAGNLAAWMRLLYPNLVDTAIASSAPVLAKADFNEYLETVGDVFRKYGSQECFDKISQFFHRIEGLLKTDDGIKTLIKEQHICKGNDLHKTENQQLLFSAETSAFDELTQYGTAEGIQEKCNSLQMRSRLLYLEPRLIKMSTKKLICNDVEFDNYIKEIKADNNSLTWIYQTCTEFGYFQTSELTNPFTKKIAVDFYYKTCTALFGPDFDEKRVAEGVLKTNKRYGGLKPNVTKVVFVNGDMDPWHRLGILEDLSEDAPAKVLPNASHCRDMFPNNRTDPEEWKEAIKYIKNLVKKWIGA